MPIHLQMKEQKVDTLNLKALYKFTDGFTSDVKGHSSYKYIWIEDVIVRSFGSFYKK